MYNIGTVTTTANSAKVIGTNTKWKESINGVQPQQIIQIIIGGTVYSSSIQSIQSNTELTLNFAFHAAVKDAKYIILTTMIDSISAVANYLVALNNANVQFSDILNRWATETGTITVTLPDGTTQQLRTAKEMDKQLEGKFDKAGGIITKDAAALALRNTTPNALFLTYETAGGTRRGWIGFPDTQNRFAITNSMTGKALVLAEDNKLLYDNKAVMKVGDYGWGGSGDATTLNEKDLVSYYKNSSNISRVFRNNADSTLYHYKYSTVAYFRTADTYSAFSADYSGKGVIAIGGNNNTFYEYYLLHNRNTTKDANGNLKAASPIVKVFADHIEPNDESEGVELKKLHTGIYQLKNVLGMHSDASWGGINGGITIPSGINQLPLVYADYDVLVAGEQHPFNGESVTADEHGDIVIYTSYRKHFDLPQNVQYARLKTYPEFTKLINDEQVELENGEPVDIPNGHWIDVRVNMPSNSIYNQKQAAAEAHAKEEAERVAEENLLED